MSKKKALEKIEQDRTSNPEAYRWVNRPHISPVKVDKQILRWRKRQKKLKVLEEKQQAREQAKEAALNPLPLIKNIFYSE